MSIFPPGQVFNADRSSAWFCGHALYLLCVIRYGLSYITFNYNSRWAAVSYRTAFVAAVATYGIVVFKAYRSRIKPGTSPLAIIMMLLSDENVQYLCTRLALTKLPEMY